jgi:chromosome segregation ATPase
MRNQGRMTDFLTAALFPILFVAPAPTENRKDDLLQRMKREAKQVIDTLKAKHQGEIEEARKGAGVAAPASPAPSQSPKTSGGPASAVGGIPEASAHVAALTRELMQLKDELMASQEACRQAGERAREAEEGARAAQEEFDVSRQWGQADVEAAQANAAAEKSRADELASECAKKDATVARIKEEAHKILAAHKADREQAAALEKRMSDAEARHKDEVAQLEGKLAEQERVAEVSQSEAEARGRVGELEGELAAARDKVASLEGEVGKLGGVVEELEGRLKEGDQLKRKVGELEAEKDEAEKEVGLLRERVGELEAELTVARQQVVSMEGVIGDLRGRMGELEGEVGTSKAEKVHDAEEKAAAAKQVSHVQVLQRPIWTPCPGVGTLVVLESAQTFFEVPLFLSIYFKRWIFGASPHAVEA